MSANRPVYMEIVEQPKQRGMRFRYECEGRSAGSIPGENATTDKKTWPTCQIANHLGTAIIRVSLVSKDDPPRPHPHSLVGRDCNNGVCQVTIDPSNQMQGVFPNLGIQCVRRKEVSTAIRDRLQSGVNPFNTPSDGDEHSAVDVDLNVVRLCFEAFLPDQLGQFTHRLKPVVSNPIYDKKATSSSVLKICRVDKTHGSVLGNDEIFLLCDKVQKDDIQVVFSFDGWEALGDFTATDVHRQVAIVFRTPKFRDEHIKESVKVEFKLRRPSDMETSNTLQFTYIPVQHGHSSKTLPNELMKILAPATDPKRKIIRSHIEARAARYPSMFKQRVPQQAFPRHQQAFPRSQQAFSRPSFSNDPNYFPPRPFPANTNNRPFYHPQPETMHKLFMSNPSRPPSSFLPSIPVKEEVQFGLSGRMSWDSQKPFPVSQPNTAVPHSSLSVTNSNKAAPSSSQTTIQDFSFSAMENSNANLQEDTKCNSFTDMLLDSLPSLGAEGTSEVLNDALSKFVEPTLPSEFNHLFGDPPDLDGGVSSTNLFGAQNDTTLMSITEKDTNHFGTGTGFSAFPGKPLQQQVPSSIPSNHVMSPAASPYQAPVGALSPGQQLVVNPNINYRQDPHLMPMHQSDVPALSPMSAAGDVQNYTFGESVQQFQLFGNANNNNHLPTNMGDAYDDLQTDSFDRFVDQLQNNN